MEHFRTHITQTANSTRNNYLLLALVLPKNWQCLFKNRKIASFLFFRRMFQQNQLFLKQIIQCFTNF